MVLYGIRELTYQHHDLGADLCTLFGGDEESSPILQTLQLHANSWFLLAIHQPETKTREFLVGIHIHLAKVSVIQRPNSD